MSPLVNHLCKIRNKNARTDNDVMRTTCQEKISDLIRKNQRDTVRNENRKHYRGSKGWWDTDNRISKVIDLDDINVSDIFLLSYKQRTIVSFLSELISSQ